MKERLIIVGKAVGIIPLSVLLFSVWLPYWIVTGHSPFPLWMRQWWKEWADAQDYQ